MFLCTAFLNRLDAGPKKLTCGSFDLGIGGGVFFSPAAPGDFGYLEGMGAAIRPGFEVEVPMSPQFVQNVVSRRLKSEGCPISGLVAPGRLELHVHGPAQHLWSPQLIVDVSGSEERATLAARFGPHPSVWTMYVAGYAACTFFAFVGASFGFAQWVMEQAPWALASVPLAFLLAGALYLVALLGQGLSESQMSELRAFLEETLSPSAS